MKKRNNYQLPQDEEIIKRLADPNYQGGSWALPESPSQLEKAKYDICQAILRHQREKQLSLQEISQKMELSEAEVKEILYCHIDHFTLDRLMSYLEKLHLPLEIKIAEINRPKLI
jgi:predicted XRE-type DNA-binding protein